MKKFLLSIILFAGLVPSAWAEMKTISLSVAGMTCSVCPITVRKALQKVNGVSEVVVDYDRKSATVSFDDQRTNPGALTSATEQAGYPSTVQVKNPS